MKAYLKLDHIDKSFARGGVVTHVLKDVSLTIEAGAFVGIAGKLAQWLSLDKEPSVWISFVISMAVLALIMRKG